MATRFITSGGLAVPSVTEDQMREVDRIAIEETGPNLFQMMENAGRNLALAAIDMLGGGWAEASVLILAGTGGNGGGGICAGRHLANRGTQVAVAVTDPARLSGVPQQQMAVFGATGGRLVEAAEVKSIVPDLVIDALVGYSLRGAPRGTARDLIDWVGESAAPVLSLDVPSGIDSTTGEAPGVYVEATTTMTLALPKTGLGNPATGTLHLADIGIPADTFRRSGIQIPAGLFRDEFVVRLHVEDRPG